jgi:hypothetical protein
MLKKLYQTALEKFVRFSISAKNLHFKLVKMVQIMIKNQASLSEGGGTPQGVTEGVLPQSATVKFKRCRQLPQRGSLFL